jgi:parallel beta-helix repeat protein
MHPSPRSPETPRTRRSLRSVVTGVAVLALGAGLVSGPAESAAAADSSDAFSRSVSAGWGSSGAAGAYSVYGPSAVRFSVDGSRGLVTGLPAGSSAGAYLPGASFADGSASATLSLVGGTPLTVFSSLELRRQPNGSAYRGRVEITRKGDLRVSVTRSDAGRETALGSSDVATGLPSGTAVRLRTQISGTDPVRVAVKAWRAGATEPDWQTSVTDGTAARITAAGSAGTWTYAGGANSATATVAVDDLSATQAAAATPAPPATPAPVANRGSAAVGTASYAVPSGALFVAPGGDDRSSGTQSAPLRSLTAAVARASARQTIVLRAGTYHEAVVVPFNKPLTIQAYPREAVWLDGSRVVSGWARSGSSWVSSGWDVRHPSSIQGIEANPYFVRSTAPLAARADQVFVNGTQLRQVATAAQVVPGTFAIDYSARTIRIGDDPTGREIRASDLRQALQIQSAGSTIQGFGVRRYATSYEDRGAIRFDNVDATLRDLVVQDNAMVGIEIGNDRPQLSRLTVQRNGMLGIGASQSYGMVLKDSIVTGNNSERFNPAPVAGGVKITRTRDVTVTNNDTSSNNGRGLWFDESCYDITVTGNDSNGNETAGIELELSDTAVIADNTTTGGEFGIHIFDTGNVRIFNNTMGDNSKFALSMEQDERRQAVASFQGQDPRRPAVDSTVPWLTRNVTVSNNVFADGGWFSIYALDKATRISVDRWNLTITGNLFTRKMDGSDPTMVAWGLGDNTTRVLYQTPEALAAAKNGTWRNYMTPGSTPLSGMTAYLGAAAALAVPLPAEIAALVGQPAGLKRVGAF